VKSSTTTLCPGVVRVKPAPASGVSSSPTLVQARRPSSVLTTAPKSTTGLPASTTTVRGAPALYPVGAWVSMSVQGPKSRPTTLYAAGAGSRS
jgi:hypothetical protein